MDIKALKKNVWELIKDSAAKDKDGDSISFQAVVGRLRERVPPQQLREVSIAYCFICLLHLANENGLEITHDTEGFAELTIHGAK